MKYMIYDKETGKPIRKEPYTSLFSAQSVVEVLISNDLYLKEDLEIKPYAVKIEKPINKIEKETNDVRTRKADKEAVAVMDRQTFISQHLDFFNGKVRNFDINRKTDADVCITIVNSAPRNDKSIKDISIRFKNDSWKNFKESRLQFAILENRLYFRGTDTDGIKLSHPTNKPEGIHMVKLNGAIPQAEQLKKFAGNYELKLDKMLKLYYVERESEDSEEN